MGCSGNKNTPKRVDKKIVTNTVEINNTISAEQYLSQAQSAQPNESVGYLIKASQQYLAEENIAKALWLAQKSLLLTKESLEINQLLLIKTACLVAINNIEHAYKTLSQTDDSKLKSASDRLTFYTLQANIQTQRGLKLAAAEATLRAFPLIPEVETEQVFKIWEELNTLSQWEIDQLVLTEPPYIKGWQQLLNFAHRFGHDKKSFQRYLTQWQRDFSLHPANAIVTQLNTYDVPVIAEHKNIAIILPLSGNQKSAGESAQQGILAAFNNADDKTLHFFDATKIDFSTIDEQLTALNIGAIIGPLLKPNVDTFLSHSSLNVPTLLLNLPTQGELLSHHMVLSMNPADEAIQAATTLARKNFKHPIVLSQKDSVSMRIAQNFVTQWHSITLQKPEIIYMNNGATMQKDLKESLEVSKSQARINDLDQRIRQKIKTEARNRRDLDMIYVVGSPKETRLLKPYVDVSISPFAKIIPMFASSRSHSDNADSSDSRDLTGLEFTEMPWLLKSKQQNASLKTLHNTLWPNKSNSLKRIFAMGYDSLALIEKFSMFKEKSYIRHYGQTGILKLTNNNVLTRSLLWGSYQQDTVQEIAMEQ